MDTNLKARIAAAVVMIPVVVGAVLFLPTEWFSAFVAAVVVLAAWEWSALVGWSRLPLRVGYSASVGTAMAALWVWPEWGDIVLWAALGYWLCCLGLIVAAQTGRAMPFLDAAGPKAVAGWLTLIPAWWGLGAIHSLPSGGPAFALLVLLLVWVADIGAYFSGRGFGRHKLAFRVSPGKTWEGVFGALLAVAVLACAFWLVRPATVAGDGAFAQLFALCIAVAVVSIVGDLTESLFKRRAGLKDSGGLIPGHGGVLDRVDSITAAAPCFALGLAAIEGLR